MEPAHMVNAPYSDTTPFRERVLRREPFSGRVLERALLELVFGGPRDWPMEWCSGLQLSSDENGYGRYGMWQEHGGPCGVIAPVQSFLILHLLEKKIKPTECTREEAMEALRHAFGTILFQIGPLVRVVTGAEVISFPSLAVFLTSDAPFRAFTGPQGIIHFVYSALLTRGVETFRNDGDLPAESKAIGNHNYSTQEFVNLLLTGRAISNVFDGVCDSGGIDLKGHLERRRVGLLTMFEHYGNIEVGENLKNPSYPIWVIHAESHFSVLFAETLECYRHGDLAAGSKAVHELVYYDPLGRFEEEKRLTISTGYLDDPYDSDDLDNNGMIDKTIRTRFGLLAEIDWNGTERIL
eukprot:GEMP01036868.1.p1 GENE.GEMP01036868.1~~GEMP01036868.1.p1  ORF type:complete len:352 (+),score=76.97 GEMP01036868.1:764-1819(+)